MKDNTYTQCTICKDLSDGGKFIHTAWIPTCLARKGQSVRIKLNTGIWDTGWVVETTGETWPRDRVLDHERDWIDMPDVTDVHREQDGRFSKENWEKK